MGEIPYNEVCLATVTNPHDHPENVSDPLVRRQKWREERTVGGITSVEYYHVSKVTPRNTTRWVRKVDLRFENGAVIRTPTGDLKEGDIVFFARHSGASGDVDDVFAINTLEWHFNGIDAVPPLPRRILMAVALLTVAVGITAGWGPQTLLWNACLTALAALVAERSYRLMRKVAAMAARKRTGAEMQRWLDIIVEDRFRRAEALREQD